MKSRLSARVLFGMFNKQHLEVLPRSQIELCSPMPPSFWGSDLYTYTSPFLSSSFLGGKENSHIEQMEVMTVWLGMHWDLGYLEWCTYETIQTYAMCQLVFEEYTSLWQTKFCFLLTYLILLRPNNRDQIQPASLFLWMMSNRDISSVNCFLTKPF